MVASSSVTNSNPTVDWADDTDEEIDFGAPVFSDDDDLPRPETLIQNQGQTIAASSDALRSTDGNKNATAPSRYTAGFADGSNRSLDRRSQNDSSLQPMSSRFRAREHPPSRRDTSAGRPSSNHQGAGRGPGGSFEREGHWKSDARRDPGAGGSSSYGSPQTDGSARWAKHSEDRGSTSGQPSSRQVIPLPPKPAAALDANNRLRIERSRSPSFRSHSPLPGTGRRRDDARQRPSSPYSDHNTALSSNTHSSGQSTRPQSPQPHLRAHMDHVSQTRDLSTRRPRDHASEGRWGKTPHEDKPYPTLPPPIAPESPKDDVIYFRRREGRVNDSPNQDRTPSGMMHHERLEANEPRPRRSERSDTPDDRWEKNHAVELDKPYPERAHPVSGDGGSHGKHTRTRSRGQVDLTTVAPSPPHVKTPRANRGKAKDQQKRGSKDRSVLNVDGNEMQDKDQGAAVPWWEESTYGAKKKEDQPPQEQTASTKSTTTAPASTASAASTASTAKKPADVKKPSTTSSGTKEEVPWWENSTYKLKPKGDLADQGSSQSTRGDSKPSTSASPSPAHRDSQPNAETLARRKALGQTNLVSGVEALTLVSRGEDDSGSNHSLKARSVQEQVFVEIKAMITRFESQYGDNKQNPISPRTRQFEDMDKIVESFRKLREGLFATETRDAFAAEVYEQSVLYSLYAGNIPELTKALHYLVQELHPEVYRPTTSTSGASTFDMPIKRQRFLGLYILYHIAKPTRSRTLSSTVTHDLLFQSMAQPQSVTDQLVVSLLHLFEQHQRGSDTGLGSDLLFALAYWKSLREGNWIRREHLLNSNQERSASQQHGPISWEQELMIRYSMGDSLGSARTISVATMSKAYYSLPVSVMAQAVGLTGPQDHAQTISEDSKRNDEWIEKLKSSYGLSCSIVVRDGNLMFKVKS